MNNDLNLNKAKSNSKNGFRPEFFDDEEFDNINFKAITDGLGFHHGDQKEVSSLSKAKKSVVSRTISAQPQTNILNEKSSSLEKTLKSNHDVMNGLEAFYKNENTDLNSKILNQKATKIKKVIKVKPADFAERSFAFVVDLFLIIAFMAITFTVVFFTSGIEYSIASKLITPEELMIYGGIIFSLNFLLYFTILDTKSSPGKMLVDIKLIRNQKIKKDAFRISAFMAFARAFLTLVQLPVFPIMFLQLQDKILGLRVIRNNEA